LNVDHNAREIKARELNDSFVGEAFSYEDSAGKETHARIAMVEIGNTSVNLYLDGVVVNGSTRILTLSPSEIIWHTSNL
jgi:hypothetical protein